MFAIQSIMLVSLGFLLAVLLAFIVAPAYWARAARLTSERLRRSLPMSEAQIRADNDRLRARHAVQIHKLEARTETANLSLARQKVEINRRDAAISNLNQKVADLETDLEASKNARRVLEHTITDRVPRVEKLLAETRNLLSQRDREMATLQSEANRTFQALNEAAQINNQQRLEIDRLQSALATRKSRMAMERVNKALSAGGEMALRSELEAYRAQTKNQASLISRLQSLVRENIDNADLQAEQKNVSLEPGLQQTGEARQLAYQSLTTATMPDADTIAQNAELVRELKARIETQESEIQQMRAALQVYEEGEDSQKSFSVRDIRIALKARIASLEKETTMQATIIRKLRAELISTNDRNARQAAYHMHELRRLGVGTYQTTISARQRADERNEADQAQRRRNLADRITEKVPTTSADLARTPLNQNYAAQHEYLPAPDSSTVSQAHDERANPLSDTSNEAVIEKVAENKTPHTEVLDVREQNQSSKQVKLFKRIGGISKR